MRLDPNGLKTVPAADFHVRQKERREEMVTQAKQILLFAVLVTLISGCVTTRYVWKSDPVNRSIENEYFTAEISPASCDSWGCEAFRLTVKNKTNKNLELNWNKTLYIVHGQTSGGFMFEGVIYKDRNNSKSPDIIFPGGKLSKGIWPNNLVEFSSGRYGGWRHESMPSGENGVYLTVAVDGKEISEKLTIVLSRTQVQN